MSDLESNAQEVIKRLLSSYGVKTQRALAEALNVPSNNVSAWSQNNNVSGCAIIKCVLDTGVDLQWLLNGKLANAKLERVLDLPSGEALLNEITLIEAKQCCVESWRHMASLFRSSFASIKESPLSR